MNTLGSALPAVTSGGMSADYGVRGMTSRRLGRIVRSASLAMALAVLAACSAPSDDLSPTLGAIDEALTVSVDNEDSVTVSPETAGPVAPSGADEDDSPIEPATVVTEEETAGAPQDPIIESDAQPSGSPGVDLSLANDDPVDAVTVDGASETVFDPDPHPDADPAGPPAGVSGVLSNIRIPPSYRPEASVRTDGEVTRAVVYGSVGTRPQVYALAGRAGQKLEAVLVAPPGVGLEVRQGGEVLRADPDGPQRLATTLVGEGELLLSVDPAGGEPGEYELTVRIGPPDPEPPPAPASGAAKRSRIEPGDVVYLTFDDGPNPRHTPEVLDILARHGARATFFVIGSLVEKYPDIFQRIVSEGHTVANHTWRHENLAGLSKAEFDETIGRTEEILGAHATPCLRPPYAATGSRTREWAAEYGLHVHLWTVSANDWLDLNGTEIADRIVSQVTAGSIVLMHDGGGNRTQTVRGLEMLLDRLADLDLRYEPLCV